MIENVETLDDPRLDAFARLRRQRFVLVQRARAGAGARHGLAAFHPAAMPRGFHIRAVGSVLADGVEHGHSQLARSVERSRAGGHGGCGSRHA